uniref:Uncharacterized protein n=1 Tax=Romanomermis culicivorax TaxID=13658 RepID=A0A915KMM8_ROMCU
MYMIKSLFIDEYYEDYILANNETSVEENSNEEKHDEEKRKKDEDDEDEDYGDYDFPLQHGENKCNLLVQ